MNTTYRLGIAAAAALAFTRAWAGADDPADASRSPTMASGDDSIAAFHDDAGVVPGGPGYRDTGSAATTGDASSSQAVAASTVSPAQNAPVSGGTASVGAPNPSDPEQQRIWTGP